MNRAMGLVLTILALAVAVRADEIRYSSGAYAGHSEEDMRSVAPSAETLSSSGALIEPREIALGAAMSFAVPDVRAGLLGDLLYWDFADLAKTAEDGADSVTVRRRWNGFPGAQDDGRGDHWGLENPDPLRHVGAAQEIPEPGTYLLVIAGLIALTLRKRRGAMPADQFERSR